MTVSLRFMVATARYLAVLAASVPAAAMAHHSTPDTLTAGTSVVVTGNPAKNQQSRSIFPVTIQQGERMLLDMQAVLREAMQPSEPPEVGSAGLDGLWLAQARWRLSPHFFTGRAHRNLTEAGAAAAAQYDHETMNPAIECIRNPPPFSMMISDVKRIKTEGEVIRITGDFDGGERRIHLNGDGRDDVSESVQGHSVGHWEGETLVIHTTHFTPHASGNGMGVPSSTGKQLIERLTLNESKTVLTYAFELSDPEFLSATLIDDVELFFRPDLRFATEPCDPETARRYLEY